MDEVSNESLGSVGGEERSSIDSKPYNKGSMQKKIAELEQIIQDMLSKQSALGESADKESERAKTIYLRRLASLVITILLFIGYTVFLESIKPGSFSSGFSNPVVLYGCLAALAGFVLLIFLMPIPARRHETFIGIDNEIDEQQEKVNKIRSWFGLIPTVTPPVPSDVASEDSEDSDYHLSISGNGFAANVRASQARIDFQIRKADNKASQLLDRGIGYMKFGLIFYIGSIFFWQFWALYFEFGPMIIIGMVSCTIAFVVIEFLAAWFFKQFRSFNDSAFAYLQVRSHFDRYLLAYHALHEYPNSDSTGKSSRDCLIDLVSEDVKWPELGGIQKNDFNYMLESMSSMTGVLDKLRGVIKKPKKSKAGEGA